MKQIFKSKVVLSCVSHEYEPEVALHEDKKQYALDALHARLIKVRVQKCQTDEYADELMNGINFLIRRQS
jgi:hypothetical protein